MTSNAGPVAREALEYLLDFREKTFGFIILNSKPVNEIELEAFNESLLLYERLGMNVINLERYSLGKDGDFLVSDDPVYKKILEATAVHKLDKLCVLVDEDVLRSNRTPINNASVSEVATMIARGSLDIRTQRLLKFAVTICNRGVPRVQFVSIHTPDTMHEELFTGRGDGTMIHRDGDVYHVARKATPKDRVKLWRLLGEHNPVIRFTKQALEHCYVFEVDDEIVAVVEVHRQGDTFDVNRTYSPNTSQDEVNVALFNLIKADLQLETDSPAYKYLMYKMGV